MLVLATFDFDFDCVPGFIDVVLFPLWWFTIDVDFNCFQGWVRWVLVDVGGFYFLYGFDVAFVVVSIQLSRSALSLVGGMRCQW